MNLGIDEAHNLTWKLALALDQSAGPAADSAPGLLDSYETERIPLAEFITRISVANFKKSGIRMTICARAVVRGCPLTGMPG